MPRLYASVLLALCIFTFGGLPAQAQPVRVGIGFAAGPYVLPEDDAGLEVDVIRDAFRSAGLDAQFVYLPNLRLPVAFAEGSVDCVAVTADYDLEKDTSIPVHASETTVVHQNYAISLEKRALSVAAIGDLADKSVLGFHNATKYLGSDFAAMAEANKRYAELADQALQVRMLFSGRVDVVISDRRIFRYWRKRLAGSTAARAVPDNRRVVYHDIFPPSPRHVAFRDRALRDHFNRGLGHLRSCGGFRVIQERYAGFENR